MTAMPQIGAGATTILVGCRRPGCVRTAKQTFPICARCWGKLPATLQGDFARSLNWARLHVPRSDPRDLLAPDRDAERCVRTAWQHARRLWAVEDAAREVAPCP